MSPIFQHHLDHYKKGVKPQRSLSVPEKKQRKRGERPRRLSAISAFSAVEMAFCSGLPAFHLDDAMMPG
jgi:hypothetical protein